VRIGSVAVRLADKNNLYDQRKRAY